MIRDSCKTSPTLASVGNLAERTFWRLITVMDDFGRYHGTDRALMAACYPEGAKGVTPSRLKDALRELESADLVRFYEAEGRRYVHSPTWAKYQRRRASESKFPQPTENKGRGHLLSNDRELRTSAAVVEDVVVDVVVPPIPPKGGCVSRFAEFWKAYPKKVGKGAAEKSWRKLRPAKGTVTAILQALRWQRRSDQWTKDRGQYIPNPATYLNQRRWEDEPPRTGPSLAEVLGED